MLRVGLQMLEKTGKLILDEKKLTNRINNLTLNTVALRVVEGRAYPQQPSTLSTLSLFLSICKKVFGLFAFLNLASTTLNTFTLRVNSVIINEMLQKKATLNALGGGVRVKIELWVL